ncbi:MAG: helix-turn-helix domain-containing protein [Acidimicrobiia bacterium]|nr:helix-turn-helix domain-containing protein [Actinomycetota bacterium]MBL6925380.1 helix-turn-helix domain-containing protein [Acidimicrobiia bacterium]MBL6926810.1 helix-turn-helix domain-containing protein [Acidimicrobiia bacterium]
MNTELTAVSLNKTNSAGSDLLDPEQAAAYLNTSIRHIRRMRDECRIAYVKIGGKLRYRRRDLDDFVDANTHQAVSDPEPGVWQ